jgi:hypothetical protein
MRDNSPPPRRLTRVGLGIAALVGFSAIYACSLIVESRDQQCQTTDDCVAAGFMGAACDKAQGICVNPTATGSGGSGGGATSSGTMVTSSTGPGGCTGDAGCWACAPTDDSEYLNGCTDSTCIPFDNAKRVLKYDGGKLPPLDGGP